MIVHIIYLLIIAFLVFLLFMAYKQIYWLKICFVEYDKMIEKLDEMLSRPREPRKSFQERIQEEMDKKGPNPTDN